MRLKRITIGLFLTLDHFARGDYEITTKGIFLTYSTKTVTDSINISLQYSRVPNNRPPPRIVNFSIFVHPGHLYSNPLTPYY